MNQLPVFHRLPLCRCILDAMFDERFRLKPAFLHNERALQRRLRCAPAPLVALRCRATLALSAAVACARCELEPAFRPCGGAAVRPFRYWHNVCSLAAGAAELGGCPLPAGLPGHLLLHEGKLAGASWCNADWEDMHRHPHPGCACCPPCSAHAAQQLPSRLAPSLHMHWSCVQNAERFYHHPSSIGGCTCAAALLCRFAVCRLLASRLVSWMCWAPSGSWSCRRQSNAAATCQAQQPCEPALQARGAGRRWRSGGCASSTSCLTSSNTGTRRGCY